MREFSFFNQNLLRLFNVSNTSHYSILVCLVRLTHVHTSMLVEKRV